METLLKALKCISVMCLGNSGQVGLILEPGTHRVLGVLMPVQAPGPDSLRMLSLPELKGQSVVYAPHETDTYESFAELLLKLAGLVPNDGTERMFYRSTKYNAPAVLHHLPEGANPLSPEQTNQAWFNVTRGHALNVFDGPELADNLCHSVFNRLNGLKVKPQYAQDYRGQTPLADLTIDYSHVLPETLHGTVTNPKLTISEYRDGVQHTYDYYYQYSLARGTTYIVHAPDGTLPPWPTLHRVIEAIDRYGDGQDELLLVNSDLDARGIYLAFPHRARLLARQSTDATPTQGLIVPIDEENEGEEICSYGFFALRDSVVFGASAFGCRLLVVSNVLTEEYEERLESFVSNLNAVNQHKRTSYIDQYYLTYAYTEAMGIDTPVLTQTAEEYSMLSLRAVSQAPQAELDELYDVLTFH